MIESSRDNSKDFNYQEFKRLFFILNTSMIGNSKVRKIVLNILSIENSKNNSKNFNHREFKKNNSKNYS